MFKFIYQNFKKRRHEVSKDIDSLLKSWPLNTKTVTARMIIGEDVKPQLQMRLDCGILQMQFDDRPDGLKPHKCKTLLEYIELQSDGLNEANLSDIPQRVWNELDREMTQFYHRRLGLLAVARQAQLDIFKQRFTFMRF